MQWLKEGGLGVLHKSMTVEQQAEKVKRVKRSESGMILDPVTLNANSLVAEAKHCMKEYSIGGIPVVDCKQYSNWYCYQQRFKI